MAGNLPNDNKDYLWLMVLQIIFIFFMLFNFQKFQQQTRIILKMEKFLNVIFNKGLASKVVYNEKIKIVPYLSTRLKRTTKIRNLPSKQIEAFVCNQSCIITHVS